MDSRRCIYSTAFAAALVAPLALPAVAAPTVGSQASAWTIGPNVGGRNFSRGVEPRPKPTSGGWYFDLPGPGGKVNYVTFRHGSLANKRRIVMRYRVESAPGVRIVPASNPAMPSLITLYFQRSGDTWSGRGRFETYRWYATFATQSPIAPGEHVISGPLNANWTAVQTSTARSNPLAFRDALANADQVGFVLGGGGGYGHGVFATGPARIVVTDFRVE
jgi:hypothetical protein